MGKLGNVAYNIGTSLNKEDINTHRQGIVPTTQILQNLNTEDRLAHHTNNQALLDENKGQLEGEMESDGVWNQGVRPPFINTNNPNARRWNVNNNPHALTVRRELVEIRKTYPNFGGIQQITNGPVTRREAAEYTAFREFIRHGTNKTYADHNVAYQKFLRSPYYQNLNRPNSTQLNIGLNNSNYNVARHEQINNRVYARPLDGAIQISGRFPLENQKPNTILYRKNNDGTITSYATYDRHGMIIKRVDMTGDSHRGIPTPHVIEYGRSHLPNGTVRVNSPDTKLPPRPARPEEIQYTK